MPIAAVVCANVSRWPNQNRDRKGADGAGHYRCTPPAPRSRSYWKRGHLGSVVQWLWFAAHAPKYA